jgi:DNA-binding MarR family transcriptional regulator
MPSPDSAYGEAVDATALERGVLKLVDALDVALEQLGSTVPPTQLRALLVIDRAGRPSLGELAKALGASASATSRLCDRMQAGDLIERAAGDDRRGVTLALTGSGRRLADWVAHQRREALQRLLGTMTPQGRAALEAGLAALDGAGSSAA